MAQVAVTIIDPSNKRSAQLVETRLPVSELIPLVVRQLQFPKEVNYQLFPGGSPTPLAPENSLAESGIPAGAELQLKPVRDVALKTTLDKLYAQARGNVEEGAWDMAKERLALLFALDKIYPDPLGLQREVADHWQSLRAPPLAPLPPTSPSSSGTSSSGTSPSLSPTPEPLPSHFVLSSKPANNISVSGTTTYAAVEADPKGGAFGGGGDPYELAEESEKSSGAGCVRIGAIVAAVLVLGGIFVWGAMTFLPAIFNDLLERTGLSLSDTAALGTGDVQVTLRWEGEANLDLHVIDPTGEEIWSDNPVSSSGGILDSDANAQCEGAAQPVENIYWPTGLAPTGGYAVSVIYYQACGHTGVTEYEVTITIDGEVADVIHAQVETVGEQHPVTNFPYASD